MFRLNFCTVCSVYYPNKLYWHGGLYVERRTPKKRCSEKFINTQSEKKIFNVLFRNPSSINQSCLKEQKRVLIVTELKQQQKIIQNVACQFGYAQL